MQRGTWVGVVFLGMGLAVIGTGAWLAQYAFSPSRPGGPDVVLLVHKGQNPNEITRQLVLNQAIQDPKRFVWLGKLTRQWQRLKTGEYQLNGQMSPLQIFSILTSGISIQYPITVREGENIYEIAKAIQEKGLGEAAEFVQLCKNPETLRGLGFADPLPPSLEGYLYPETYFFNRTLTLSDMIRLMHKRFLAEWTNKDENRARQLNMTRHQVITLASIIEKETGAQQERPMIGSVFHNRLRKKMKLQSDPTTIYGIWERYDGNIHKSDLSSVTPFNTYVVPALPVGPISNPGRQAIQAALFPVESEFLFFVSQNNGTHRFTRTYGDHLSAVKQFQIDPKARAGKSWRDLNP